MPNRLKKFKKHLTRLYLAQIKKFYTALSKKYSIAVNR